MEFKVYEGNYTKMGTFLLKNGVVFTFEGEKEDDCKVLLFNKQTMEMYSIDVPASFCLGSLRSVRVEGIDVSQYVYLYEINGKKVIDPYAHKVFGREIWNDLSRKDNDFIVYGDFLDEEYLWKEDVSPEISREEMVMYKLHIRGFSMDGKWAKKAKGTFEAVEQKLDYLKDLGVTTIELMPVYDFEEVVVPVKTPLPDYINWEADKDDMILPEEIEEPIKLNYWGYGPANYFAVKASYAKNVNKAALEFQNLIAKMHKLNLECIMELYFASDANHNLILEVLRYWVREFHVDGFHLLGENLPITAIVQDVLLSRTKIFYVDYDYSLLNTEKKYKNLYVYKEEYQYPVRKILNHINGDMVEFANQQKKQGVAQGYINFVASNNGFTLMDMLMYNDRHNEANGENNADGNPWNFSSNYGVEGPTRKKFVLESRKRQWRNAVLILFLAQGVPLLWSGDEICNSQKGNNNAYCQDNEIGWLNWKNEKSHKEEFAYMQKAIAFRKKHSLICKETPFRFSDYKSVGTPDLSYHGENAWISDFDYGRMSIGMMYCGAYAREIEEDIYIGYNFYSAVASLALPKLSKKKWYLIEDSSWEEHLFEEKEALKNQQTLSLNPQSICILIAK